MIVKKYLTHNGNLIQRGANKFVYRNYDKPAPVFPSVQIGNQIWMSENLSIDDGGEGIVIRNNVTYQGYNFGTQYYYTWTAADRIVNNIEGWRIPTITDFDNLQSYLQSQGYYDTAPLRSVERWNTNPGTNIFGLNIEPVGSIRSSYPDVDLYAVGAESMLRIDNPSSPGAWCNFMYGMHVNFTNWTYRLNMPNCYIAVRLIKDSE